MKTKEEIAQYVINNRFAISQNEKVSDFEMYHDIVYSIKELTPQWIKVTDRLPEESNSVLCYNGNHIRIGFLDKYFNMLDGKWTMMPRIWKDSIRDNILEWDVTHWMPLPEKPN